MNIRLKSEAKAQLRRAYGAFWPTARMQFRRTAEFCARHATPSTRAAYPPLNDGAFVLIWKYLLLLDRRRLRGVAQSPRSEQTKRTQTTWRAGVRAERFIEFVEDTFRSEMGL